MVYLIIFILLFFLIIFYFFYKSYTFQLFLHKNSMKKFFVENFKDKVKGKYIDKGYFASSHKIISDLEYNNLSNSQKINFSKCYNIISFKTKDAKMEIFFNLIREGLTFVEVFNLRIFPNDVIIKSQGNVEKNFSRINVFTNNRYLTKILETTSQEDLKWLIRYNGDILLISGNNLHFKAMLGSSKLSSQRVLDMVKSMYNIKFQIYKKDILEY